MTGRDLLLVDDEDNLRSMLEAALRHSGFEVRDERTVEQRSFPDWSMELVRVSASYFEAKDTVADRLPGDVDGAVRERIMRMTEAISGNVAF